MKGMKNFLLLMKQEQSIQYCLSAFLYLIILALIGGNYLLNINLFGFEFYAFRIITFVTLLYLLIVKRIVLYNSRFSAFIFYGLLFWLVYGFISLAWTSNKLFGIKELYYVFIGVCLYVVLFSLRTHLKNFTQKLETVWVVGFIIVFILSYLEYFTGRHLYGDFIHKLEYLGYYHKLNFVPVTFFSNPNPFSTYVALSMVLSIYYILKGKNVLLNSAIIFSSSFLFALTESRLSYILIGIVLLLLFAIYARKFFYFMKNKGIGKRPLTIISISFILLIASTFLSSVEMEWFDNNADNASKSAMILESADTTRSISTEILPDKIYAIEVCLKEKCKDGEPILVKEKQVDHIQLNGNQESFNQLRFISVSVFTLTIIGMFFLSFLKWKSNMEVWKVVGFAGSIVAFFLFLFSFNSFQLASPRDKNIQLVSSELTTNASQEMVFVSVTADVAKRLKEGKEVEVRKHCPVQNNTVAALSSDKVRLNLILNGIDFLQESNYLGLGAGGFREYNIQKKGKRPIGNVLGAHNFVIEIIVQFGIFVFLIGFGLFAYIFWRLIKAFVQKRWTPKHMLVLMLLLCVLITGNNNSTYLSLPINWLIVVLLLIESERLFKREKENA